LKFNKVRLLLHFLKKFTWILFFYFSAFFIVGANNVKSIFFEIADEIVYCLKDIKKDMDSDGSEKEDEKAKDFFCNEIQLVDSYDGWAAVHFLLKNDDKDHVFYTSIFIPPPDNNI
jgi:hypothetical protein